jgi:ferredoxin
MAKYRVMYWKDIPQSFTVEGDGQTIKKELSQKVQNKIDAYAMALGATSTTDYAKQYKRGSGSSAKARPKKSPRRCWQSWKRKRRKLKFPNERKTKEYTTERTENTETFFLRAIVRALCGKPMTKKHNIILQPSGRRGQADEHTSVRSAARELGVEIESICAENATCGKCMVLVEEGRFEKYNIDSKRENLSPVSNEERHILRAVRSY